MSKKEVEQKVELESQIILRLPPEPAKFLREALKSGNLAKDRLSIKIDNDMRYGEVRFDHWLLYGKVVDLPTIVESLKTIDNKSFYKTADICQMLLCKEEDDHTATDEESPIKQKKKDPHKVDKKFLWPHGLTPPTKNIRRRRFRKTLKKKYVEAPEIEKEVKRLLRIDNDAINVSWEVICEDEDQNKTNVPPTGTVKPKRENTNSNTSQSVDVAEHEIFGEAVSDSEEDDPINVMELDESSRISAEIDVFSRDPDSNSMLTDSNYLGQSLNTPSTSAGNLVTEFSREMFISDGNVEDIKPMIDEKIPKVESNFDVFGVNQEYTKLQSIDSKDTVQHRLETLHSELAQLQSQRKQQELTIETIENMKLRERIQEIIDNLALEEAQKMQEINDLNSMIDSL